MFKKKIKEIEIRCIVCGKHVSTEEVRKAHYIAREPKRGNALTLNAEPTRYDVFDCPHCGCQNILYAREIRVDEPNAGERGQ